MNSIPLQARGFVESLATGSRHSADVGLVRSVLAAGFYPQVRPNSQSKNLTIPCT